MCQDILKATVCGVFEDLKSLKFHKARTKIEVVLTLPCCWLSQLNFGPSLLQKLYPSQYLDTKLGETPNVLTYL